MDMKLRGVDPATLEAPATIATMRHIIDGFKSFQVLRAGFRSGLFDWLENNAPAERSMIATALNLRGAHLAGFLQALEDQGLLVKQDTTYSLAPGMSSVLCSSSPWCQAKVIEELVDSSSGWSSLGHFLSNTWTSSPRTSLPPAQHPFAGEANRLSRYLAARFENRAIHNMLCFDDGDGLFAIAASAYFPDTEITVVVQADAQQRVRQTLAEYELDDRCRVLTGTPVEVPTTELFNLVVLFHSLYPVRRMTNDALAAVAARLAPDGELHCAHWFCLEACETAPGGLRDLDKAVLTDSHPMCHVETFCQRFEKIGLIDADRDDLIGEYGTTKVHYARRPMQTQES